jgi:phage terminase small subunit
MDDDAEDDTDEGMDEEDEGDEDDEDDEHMDEDEVEGLYRGQNDRFPQARMPSNSRHSQSVVSRNGITQDLLNPQIVQPGAKQSQYDLLSIAKGLTPNMDRAPLREPDEVILGTERLLEKLHESILSGDPEKRNDVLGEISQELISLWQTSSPVLVPGQRDPLSGQSRTSLHLPLANRLASLLLSIHHPSPITQRARQSSYSLVHTTSDPRYFTPIPKVLLDWLKKNNQTISEIALVLREQEGYSANEYFWDAVWASAARGDFSDTLKLLKGANFSVAATAAQDGLGEDGYRGDHLYNTNQVIQAAIDLIGECPAAASEDWDVKGNDWDIFRQRVHFALKDLQEFAEGESSNRHSFSHSFQASHFGLSQSQNSLNLSVASRKAESRVPWTIYESLTRLYKQLMGVEEDVIAAAADWIEAVVFLTVWWNGEEADGASGSLAVSHRSLARSQRVRTSDITPVKAYCERLAASLAAVVERGEEGLDINTTDNFDIGLACIFDDNIEGALQILRGWSPVVASAVAEVASSGDWFRRADGILDQFDEGDLMVLSYNEDQRMSLSKDDLLMDYANQLAAKDQVTSRDGKTSREGWELAIQVLDRLDVRQVADVWIGDTLDKLELSSPERVDKITQFCYSMGLSKHAQKIALVCSPRATIMIPLTYFQAYAEELRNNTQNYGDTLLYYARAHEAAKIQEVLRVLVAHCLVKSIAYPPLAQLDESLRALITSPKQTLTNLATHDPEGAELLSNYLSGYATIRKFYDLRDEGILASEGQKPAHRPMVRKRAAAHALMVIISSAASSIRGGLYDPDIETVVQVDVLLPLLGEALLFVNQDKRTLTLKNLYSLLAAVEDLDTAPSMIRAQCEEVLSTTLAAAHEGRASDSRSLNKSTSNLTTASSQYSLIGSTDFSSAGAPSMEGSAVLVKGGSVDDAKRAWDWRKGFSKKTTGRDVIRLLRLGIAKETARAFAEGEV